MANHFTTNAAAVPLFQEGLIETAFHGPMIPMMGFVGEFKPELWTGGAPGAGKTLSVYRTKHGTMAPDAQALPFKTDPAIGDYRNEQYLVDIFQVGQGLTADNVAIDLARFDLWKKDMSALQSGAAKTKMMLARAALYNTGLAGGTICTTTGNNSTKRLLKLNGFTKNFGSNDRLDTISATNPLPVHFWVSGVWLHANATGYTPDPITQKNGVINSSSEYLSGTITLDGNVDTGQGGRVPCYAGTASFRIFSGGSANNTIDDIGQGDIITGNDILLAAAWLKDKGVPKYPDGHYHCHLSPYAMYNLLQDTRVELLFRGKGLEPSDPTNPYVNGTIALITDVLLFENSYCPQPGSRMYAPGIGETCAAETATAAGIPLHTAIVCGYGEDERRENWYTPLADMQGANGVPTMTKIGNWIEDGSYMKAVIDHMEVVLGAPKDLLGRVPTMAYSFTGGFEVQTDLLSDVDGPCIDALAAYSANAIYKRVVPVIHAIR